MSFGTVVLVEERFWCITTRAGAGIIESPLLEWNISADRTESIEAFYVPKGTFVKLNPLIVHGTQYPVDKEDVHIVCMLPGRTFKNDMLSRRLETGEQIRITRGYKK